MTTDKEVEAAAGKLLAHIIFGPTIGAIAFDYLLWNLFQKDVPFYADMIIGFFFMSITVPVAIITFVLKMCGVDFPL